MFGLPITDVIVLGFYFVGITLLGIWMMWRVKTIGDFIMPHRFGKLTMMMHGFGTGTHSDQAVSVASKTYTNGLSGIWYQWLWLFATPFYWLIAPVMRRFRALTTADVFAARYNHSVAMLFAIVGLFNMMVNIGTMLKGSGAIIDASTGGKVNSDAAIMIMTILFVVYGIAGGLSAAIVTDFIQGILTFIFSFLLLPFLLNAVGGITSLHDKIKPEMFSLVAPGEIGLFYIIVISLNGLIGIVTQPHTMGNCAAGKSEFDGRVGWVSGNFLKRICTIAWCLTGLAAVAYYSGKGLDPDKIYGQAAKDFLPLVMPGLLGLLLASLLASVMSSCDSFMIASSGLFTENIYKWFFRSKSDVHYIRVARLAAFVVVAGGVYFAYWLPNVIKGLEIFWKIAPMMGIAFWLGLFWRRTTVAGAWAATLTGFGVWWLSTQAFFITFMGQHTLFESAPFVWDKIVAGKSVTEIYMPWQMTFYLSSGTLAGIIVSLFTRPVSEEKLETFYALVRTPSVAGELISKPCTLPEGVIAPPKRKLFPGKNLEILVPSLTSIAGFFLSWGIVAGIVYVFYRISIG